MNAVTFPLPVTNPIASNRVNITFDTALYQTLSMTMQPASDASPQNFSLPLLRELRAIVDKIQANKGCWYSDGRLLPVQYAVLRSAHPTYFSVGGDLKYFRECIQARDRAALYDYSRLCVDVMHDMMMHSQKSTTSIALVQGKALGGGFECALSADALIAEEHSEFGFPEIMFGLFPCTGAMSLLARRVGVHQAERMMSSSRIYSAGELKDMGIVDEICPTAEGDQAVAKYIMEHARRRGPRMRMQRARHRISPVDYSELIAVVEEWSDLAMTLSTDELRVMDMLIMMQSGIDAVNTATIATDRSLAVA